MDAHAHQPGEELADFTENELLSLIDAGTAGAYSEIYRRYRDDAVARASSSLPDATARQVVDGAFLSVLRSLLNRSSDTAEDLRSMVDAEIDVHLANPTSANGADSSGDVSSANAEAPEAALVSQALSNLPDNWQRILWLCEVERLSPEAVAEQLNIKASTVERLADRAHQGLQDEWQKVRPTDSKAAVDHRAALIPALLTSPIVIERLSATLAQAIPEPAPAVAEMTAAEEPAGAGTGIGNAPALKPAGAEANSGTEAEWEADTAPEAIPATASSSEADESAEASGTSAETASDPAGAAGISAGTADTTAGATNTVEPVSLAAFGTQSAATQTSTQTPAATRFSMPKPVLIPVVAACIGLLGTLVGVAIVPQQGEQTGLYPGNAGTAVSPADSFSKKEDKNSSSHSPDGTSSDKQDQESGSGKSRTSDPDRDEGEKSSRNPGHDDSRSDDSPSTEDNPDDKSDNGDRPSAEEPDQPSPSDSDRPDPESPSEPTPSTPDDPESPSDPPPSESEDPTPSDPPPSDEPTDPTPPPEEPTEDPGPSDPPSSDAGTPSEPDPTQDDSSSTPENPAA